jgi:hypothetical protein
MVDLQTMSFYALSLKITFITLDHQVDAGISQLPRAEKASAGEMATERPDDGLRASARNLGR